MNSGFRGSEVGVCYLGDLLSKANRLKALWRRRPDSGGGGLLGRSVRVRRLIGRFQNIRQYIRSACSRRIRLHRSLCVLPICETPGDALDIRCISQIYALRYIMI